MGFERDIDQAKLLLINMGLNEYQASALAHLILLGETKATALSKASGVPSARIYEVLNELAKMGLITVRPGRPIRYKPMPPADLASTLIQLNMNQLKQRLKLLEGYAKDFAEFSNKIYLKGEKGVATVPLLRIVSVGETSLGETKKLYNTAKREILILSRALEYFPEVSANLKKALTKGATLRIILTKPVLLGPRDRKKQAATLERIREELGTKVELRFADEVPIRGCIIDPEAEGKAFFLVEDPGVPFFLREGAISSHPSVVRGLALMFNLLWEHKAQKV